MDAREFVAWLVSLDDPDPESRGFQDRRTVTLSDIIEKARSVDDNHQVRNRILGELSGHPDGLPLKDLARKLSGN